MNLANHNYGLRGQSELDYDYFICLGKKCKRKKEKRRRIRNEKKKLKNDARRADIERTRAETGMIKQTFGPTLSTPLKRMVRPSVTGTIRKAQSNSAEPVPQIGTAKVVPWILFGGLVLIGGAILTKTKRTGKT